jgi:acyl-CoA synthetase (AMP-forming)/AMP-acid ligase II
MFHMTTTRSDWADLSRPGVIPDSLAGYVDYYSKNEPKADAVVFGSERITYRQLKKDIDHCARAMLACGLDKGDRVAMLCTPRPEFWTVFLAATHIGLTWVGLNPAYRRDELRHIVADCQPKMLFSIAQFEGRAYGDDLIALMNEFPSVEKLIAIDEDIQGAVSLGDFLLQAADTPDSRYRSAILFANAQDAALLVYTSGTTGKPKGALLSNHGLTRGATMQATHFGIENQQVVVNFPINHVACVADTCATTLVKGGKIVFQERFDPVATLQAMQDEKCSLIAGVPTMLQMMLDQPGFDQYDLSSVECVVWGGAAMPRDGIARLRNTCPRLLSVYGLTESSANIVFSQEGDSLEALAESIGKPDASIECRIVDDAGNLCTQGSTGELQFRADFFFLGYWNQPQASRDAFSEDGWLKTGDIGFLRDDGNLELVGRKSEMFKSGGENVYPREIEVILESLPEVAMAAVIGVPDDVFQEVGHAFVMLEPGQQITADELRDLCKNKLANYKVPKIFEVRLSLPVLPVGKIDKQTLKQEALTTS